MISLFNIEASFIVEFDSVRYSPFPALCFQMRSFLLPQVAQIKPDCRKSAYLGIRIFCSTSVTCLQSHLSLQNTLLKSLGCLNPVKRDKGSNTDSKVGCQHCSR